MSPRPSRQIMGCPCYSLPSRRSCPCPIGRPSGPSPQPGKKAGGAGVVSDEMQNELDHLTVEERRAGLSAGDTHLRRWTSGARPA